jgi:hypothetical protein
MPKIGFKYRISVTITLVLTAVRIAGLSQTCARKTSGGKLAFHA